MSSSSPEVAVVGKTLQALAQRLYRLLLLAYPRRFRRQVGEEMAEMFTDQWAAATKAGPLAVLDLCSRTLFDVARNAWSERSGKASGGQEGAGSPPAAAADRDRLNAERTAPARAQQARARREAPLPEPGGYRPSRRSAMDNMGLDLRFACRVLARSPGFTATAALALALGIGASTSVFSIVDALLLSPLPYADAERLVMLWETDVDGPPLNRNTPSPANYVDWRAQAAGFEGMAAYVSDYAVLTGQGEPERLHGYRVTADFFPVLGVGALLGRTLRAEEDIPANRQVVVLSHALYRERFAGDPNVIGARIVLGGEPYTVVGVMPADFEFPSGGTDYWIPMAMEADEEADRRSHYLQILGRLAEGLTLERARNEMDTIAARLEAAYPATNTDTGVLVRPLRDEMVGDLRPALLVVTCAIAFVLLTACANVANLLLARASGRRGEIAVRSALGAGRWRICRQLLAESAALAVLGGVVGVVLSIWGVRLLAALVPEEVPISSQVGLDFGAVAFALSLSLGSALLFGLAPAVRASRPQIGVALNEGGRGGSQGHPQQRFRSVLVATEIALAMVLLVGAGLLIRSFASLIGEPLGFRADHLLTVRFELFSVKYEDYAVRVDFYDRVLEQVRALPGVESAGMTTFLPLSFSGGSTSVTIEDRAPRDPGERVFPVFRVVSPGYLETMGVPLRGRGFTEHDREGSPSVVVVNGAFAREFWPGEDALGRRLKIGDQDSPLPWMEVIGIAGDVRQFAMEAAPRPEFYVSYLQSGDRGFFTPRDLVLRTAGPPLSHVAAVRSAVRSIDADMPLSNVGTMEGIVARSVEQRRFNMLLIGAFAAAALVLAAVGIYGVVSYSVSSRTREIGVRIALGAIGADVVGLVLRQGVVVIGWGTAIGVVGALLATRLLESLLYEVSALDLATFVVVPALLALVAGLATLFPARRAARLDPLIALRSD